MSDRPTRGDIFMQTAYLFAERSTCNRGNVGTVLVDGNHIIAHGYNGAPPGLPHCTDVGCEYVTVTVAPHGPEDPERVSGWMEGCQRTVHAEANAIAYAARHGISTAGSTMFSTHSPCRKCLELAASAGVKEIVYDTPYRATPWDMALELGIQMAIPADV